MQSRDVRNYKYPYIADKRMYAAVMGACKWIRESGYFNKAVSYYADKYNVDEDELAKHIRARQAAGQKGKKRGNYKFFVVRTIEACGHDPVGYVCGVNIRKALNERNAKQSWLKFDMANDTGSEWSPYRFDEIMAEFATKEEAENALIKNEREWWDSEFSR